ncbi:hypothetical protein [Butyrivibrio sp. LC3010]|uniref:hypothetical protein n=1 Tax=Butyrivibrio sp. LC3010 TaxID=1280680 RepID=UPI0004081003|nr:hypothetical protein [Butyrivibrio sp. LC3010]
MSPDNSSEITNISHEQITALTDSAIEMCAKMANIEISPTGNDSLNKLDNVIDQIKSLRKKNLVTEEIARNIAAPFGILAGEIMLNNKLKDAGFLWVTTNNSTKSEGLSSIILSDKAGINTIDTISMVYKTLLDDNESKSSLNQFFEAFSLVLSMTS